MKEIFNLVKDQIPILIELQKTIDQITNSIEFLVVLGALVALFNLPETILGIVKTARKIEKWLRNSSRF